MVIGASCLTGIINCQIRKENPSQTLSDVAVDFYDVRPTVFRSLTIRGTNLYNQSLRLALGGQMYAVIQTGGKQYRVAPGDTIRIERVDGKVGEKVNFGAVLA